MENIRIELDSAIYSKEAIVKCLYWYSDDYIVDIKLVNNTYIITLNPSTQIFPEKLTEIKKDIKRQLMDYNLRDIVKKETTPIRELIIAKAFSHGEYDEEPKGDLMDPLGIKFL